MSYIEVQEEIKQIDLYNYLANYEPSELQKVTAREYTTRRNGSLKISNGKWFWFKEGVGGRTALSYLVKVRNMEYKQALKHLADCYNGYISKIRPIQYKEKTKEIKIPKKSKTTYRAEKYLKSRGIDKEIIKECIKKGLIYEKEKYGSPIFVGRDEEGKIKYTSERWLIKERICTEAEGSDKRYSFCIEGASKTLHIFESPIDLLSYASLEKMYKKDWRKETKLSIGGVSGQKIPLALEYILEKRKDIKEIKTHLDNDEAGNKMTKNIQNNFKEKYKVYDKTPKNAKDVNDLLNIIKNKKVRRKER